MSIKMSLKRGSRSRFVVLGIPPKVLPGLARGLGFAIGYSLGHVGNLLEVAAAKCRDLRWVDQMTGVMPRVVCRERPQYGFVSTRRYGISWVVTDMFVTSDHIRRGVLYYPGSNEKAPRFTSRLMVQLMAIDGVDAVRMYPNEVVVGIGKAYNQPYSSEWSHIEPQIMQVLCKSFKWKETPAINRYNEGWGGGAYTYC